MDIFYSKPVSFLMFPAANIYNLDTDKRVIRIYANYIDLSNVGINYPQAGIGINYFVNLIRELPFYKKKEIDKKLEFCFDLGFTTKKNKEILRFIYQEGFTVHILL